MPKISVIVPVYKAEDYLHACVDSILRQTETDLEIILVDDGSPDGCGAICDEYAAKDRRVKVIHQENRGVSAARNAGLDGAAGEYIGFVDADDYIDPDMYEALLAALQQTGAEVAECNYRREEGAIDGDGSLHTCCGREAAVKMFTEDGYPIGFTVSPCTKLFSASAAGQLRFLTGCSMAEDMLFATELFCKAQKAVKLNRRLYTYRIHQGSATLREYHVRMADEVDAAAMAMEVMVRSGDHRLAKIGRSRYANLTVKHWCLCRRAAETEKARQLRSRFCRDYAGLRPALTPKQRLKCDLFRAAPGLYFRLLGRNSE